jgi:hypothetical protein
MKVCPVKKCEHCGKSIKSKKAIEYDRRKVFDTSLIIVEVTEHRAEIKEFDGCGKLTIGESPKRVTYKVQYGLRLKANAVANLDVRLMCVNTQLTPNTCNKRLNQHQSFQFILCSKDSHPFLTVAASSCGGLLLSA